MNLNSIPKATLGRLPSYLSYLKSVRDSSGHISATAISKALGFGEVQVRKDLAAVSGAGKPKIGYITNELIEKLEAHLGQNGCRRAVVVGAGKLGTALLDYEGFSDYGVTVEAAFDINPGLCSVSSLGKPIYPMDEFAQFCRKNDIKIGIITVPKNAAQDVLDLMVENNINAVWSFAPTVLHAPENVVLKQENLALSLAHLYNRA